MTTDERLNYLLERYTNHTETPDEYTELMQLINNGEKDGTVKQWMELNWPHLALAHALPSGPTEDILNFITVRGKNVIDMPASRKNVPVWLRYAAILLLLLGGSIYLFYNKANSPSVNISQRPAAPADIAPGGNRALLTLADGSTIVLDSAANGHLAEQGGTNIIKSNDGQLAYNLSPANIKPEVNGSGTTPAMIYNTISTPRGGQYRIVLPDGSKVWLNAASSVRFPTTFSGKDRKVTITGEVYFEIESNSSQPFFVNAGNATVQVLGTSFNVNAYQDGIGIRATLLRGSINVGNGIQKALLNPGQQAHVEAAAIKVLNNVDTDKVMAWKNGAFNFKDAGLAEVMHQLERWYDIDVVYEKGIPDITFWGKMSRSLKLSDVLKALKGSGVHFRIEEGRKVIVMP